MFRFLLCCVVVGLLASPVMAQTPTGSTGVVAEVDTSADNTPALPPAVRFRTGAFEDILKQAHKEKKLVLLDFWAVWCQPCHRLDRLTFSNVPLGEFINSRFVPYRVNIDDFSGMDLVDRYGVNAYPAMLVVDAADGTVLHKLTGFYLPTYLQVELERALSIATAQAAGKKKKKS